MLASALKNVPERKRLAEGSARDDAGVLSAECVSFRVLKAFKPVRKKVRSCQLSKWPRRDKLVEGKATLVAAAALNTERNARQKWPTAADSTEARPEQKPDRIPSGATAWHRRLCSPMTPVFCPRSR